MTRDKLPVYSGASFLFRPLFDGNANSLAGGRLPCCIRRSM